MELHEVLERLDKQANAIRNLRERVNVLEAGARASTPPDEEEPALYLPSTCLICGNEKDGKRAAMTCRSCSDERFAAIKTGGKAREKFMTATCGLCLGPKGRNTTIVCGKCRRGLKKGQQS